MNKLIVLLIIFSFCYQAKCQNKIILQFEGRSFDKLNMVVRLDIGEEDFKRETIKGKSDNGTKWCFEFNDSIFSMHAYVSIEGANNSQTEFENIGFNNIVDNDTLFAGGVCLTRGESTIFLEYFKSKTIAKNTYYDELLGANITKLIFQAHFLVDSNCTPAILSSIEAIGLGYCMFRKSESSQYSEQLKRYIAMTRKYPESRNFAWLLSQNVTAFKSKEDIYAIYECFNSDVKKSIFGKRIKGFLDATNTIFEFQNFENTLLRCSSSNEKELIVKDTSKFNLVIFSASWCSPCHEQIPLLKEIYNKYSDKINLTYISMDKERTVNNWYSLMIKENIQWRSLIAVDELEKIREQYYVVGIPHTLLVYPGGKKLEILDVREKENYNKLIQFLEN